MACGETFIQIADRERFAGETFTLVSQFVSLCRLEVPAIFQCKNVLDLVHSHIYVLSVVCNWNETLCSHQVSWRTAFTHTYVSDLSMWRDFRSYSTKGTVCRTIFYTAFSICFLVPVWSSCSFHWNTDLEIVPTHTYGWSVVGNWKENLCSQQPMWKTVFTCTFS